MPDVLGQRPVRPAGIGGRGSGDAPRRVIESGPRRDQAIPEGHFIGPEVALGRAHVHGPELHERGATEVDRGRDADEAHVVRSLPASSTPTDASS